MHPHCSLHPSAKGEGARERWLSFWDRQSRRGRMKRREGVECGNGRNGREERNSMEGGSWESEAITEHELRTAQSRGGGSTETGGRRGSPYSEDDRKSALGKGDALLFGIRFRCGHERPACTCFRVTGGFVWLVSICLNIARRSGAQQIRDEYQKSARETMLHNCGLCRENTTHCCNDGLQI